MLNRLTKEQLALMERASEMAAQYGPPGSKIAESTLWRGYCQFCKEPIRVVNRNMAIRGECACERCLSSGNPYHPPSVQHPIIPRSEVQYNGDPINGVD